jgi:hypothetical protein
MLSTKTPFMVTRKGEKVFLSKEYTNAQSKFHFVFNDLYNMVSTDLTEKLDKGDEQFYNSSGVMTFFKTVLGNRNELECHPLLSDKPFLRELKKQVKRFEVALRNFEIVYIDMLKTLQVKIMDIDSDQKFD